MREDERATNVAASSFGALLRRYRLAACLTQAELAERAGLSAPAVGQLERGVRQRPYPETVRALGEALGLSAPRLAAFVAAAHADGAAPLEPAAEHGAPRGNLPAPLTSFVGRTRELAEVRARLAGARLLTLSGPGGSGKSRLAQEAARGEPARYPAGVWLVELAALADPALLPGAVAEALGVPLQQAGPGRPLLDLLRDHLRHRRALLLLDNCEHLVAACADLAQALLAACPDLTVLCTSREALGVPGEVVWSTPGLSVPPVTARGPALLDAEAVQLLLERARAVGPAPAPVGAQGAAVAAICRALEGLPLAIELAAARLALLSVEQVAARLGDQVRLLRGGARVAPARQRTLEATLDWSYRLLSDPEQALLRRLSVFAGGCTLEAAESVCAATTERASRTGNGAHAAVDPLPPGAQAPGTAPEVAAMALADADAAPEDANAAPEDAVAADAMLELLGGLVAKSLVQTTEQAGAMRYRLLEPVRQYTWARLAPEDAAALRARHLRWCLALAEQAEWHQDGAEQSTWLAHLEREHDNLRAALRWSVGDNGAPVEGARLACAVSHFWYARGHLEEGRRWQATALTHSAALPVEVRARLLGAAGHLAMWQGDLAQAQLLLDQAVELWRQVGDTTSLKGDLLRAGAVAHLQGDIGRAWIVTEQALQLAQRQSDSSSISRALGTLGHLAAEKGDYHHATKLLQQNLALAQSHGHTGEIARALVMLGDLALYGGDYDNARSRYVDGLALYKQLGDTMMRAMILMALGHIYYLQHAYVDAQHTLNESLALQQQAGDRYGIAASLEVHALLIAKQGSASDAARVAGASEALREALGTPQSPPDQALYRAGISAAREALGEDGYAAALAAGRALSIEQAIALALAPEQPPDPAPTPDA